MGRDKRLLTISGETLVQRNLRFLLGLFPTVALSVREASQAPADLPLDSVTDGGFVVRTTWIVDLECP